MATGGGRYWPWNQTSDHGLAGGRAAGASLGGSIEAQAAPSSVNIPFEPLNLLREPLPSRDGVFSSHHTTPRMNTPTVPGLSAAGTYDPMSPVKEMMDGQEIGNFQGVFGRHGQDRLDRSGGTDKTIPLDISQRTAEPVRAYDAPQGYARVIADREQQGNTDWEKLIESADQKQAELFHTQFSLIREQMAKLTQESMVMRQAISGIQSACQGIEARSMEVEQAVLQARQCLEQEVSTRVTEGTELGTQIRQLNAGTEQALQNMDQQVGTVLRRGITTAETDIRADLQRTLQSVEEQFGSRLGQLSDAVAKESQERVQLSERLLEQLTQERTSRESLQGQLVSDRLSREGLAEAVDKCKAQLQALEGQHDSLERTHGGRVGSLEQSHQTLQRAHSEAQRLLEDTEVHRARADERHGALQDAFQTHQRETQAEMTRRAEHHADELRSEKDNRQAFQEQLLRDHAQLQELFQNLRGAHESHKAEAVALRRSSEELANRHQATSEDMRAQLSDTRTVGEANSAEHLRRLNQVDGAIRKELTMIVDANHNLSAGMTQSIAEVGESVRTEFQAQLAGAVAEMDARFKDLANGPREMAQTLRADFLERQQEGQKRITSLLDQAKEEHASALQEFRAEMRFAERARTQTIEELQETSVPRGPSTASGTAMAAFMVRLEDAKQEIQALGLRVDDEVGGVDGRLKVALATSASETGSLIVSVGALEQRFDDFSMAYRSDKDQLWGAIFQLKPERNPANPSRGPCSSSAPSVATPNIGTPRPEVSTPKLEPRPSPGLASPRLASLGSGPPQGQAPMGSTVDVRAVPWQPRAVKSYATPGSAATLDTMPEAPASLVGSMPASPMAPPLGRAPAPMAPSALAPPALVADSGRFPSLAGCGGSAQLAVPNFMTRGQPHMGANQVVRQASGGPLSARYVR